MKGLTGSAYVQWETDKTGRIWLASYSSAPAVAIATSAEAAKLATMRLKWSRLVNTWADFHAVPRSWVWGLMLAESGGNPLAVSPAGALGLMQIMPMHSKGRNLLDPATNLEIACGLIAQLSRGGFDLLEVSSQYNAGPAKGGGPKRSDRFDFGMVNEIGTSQVPAGTVRKSAYLRTIAAGNNGSLTSSPAQPATSKGLGTGFLVAGIIALLISGQK
jgi:soluble lytic murein transglycosylase-like protein